MGGPRGSIWKMSVLPECFVLGTPWRIIHQVPNSSSRSTCFKYLFCSLHSGQWVHNPNRSQAKPAAQGPRPNDLQRGEDEPLLPSSLAPSSECTSERAGLECRSHPQAKDFQRGNRGLSSWQNMEPVLALKRGFQVGGPRAGAELHATGNHRERT